MAKKTRPTFSVPRDSADAGPAGSHWVYRSEAAPANEAAASTPARDIVPRPAPIAAPLSAPARSSIAVNYVAYLLFPVAVITGLVVEPLAACVRRRR